MKEKLNIPIFTAAQEALETEIEEEKRRLNIAAGRETEQSQEEKNDQELEELKEGNE